MSSLTAVSKNHWFSMVHVLFVCGYGWAFLPVCINNTNSAVFKHFNPLVHMSQWWTVLILGSQLLKDLCPFIPSDTKNCIICITTCCLSLVQTASAAVIFMSCSLCINRLQMNHTRSMSLSDHELQHYQAPAVLPITQSPL